MLHSLELSCSIKIGGKRVLHRHKIISRKVPFKLQTDVKTFWLKDGKMGVGEKMIADKYVRCVAGRDRIAEYSGVRQISFSCSLIV